MAFQVNLEEIRADETLRTQRALVLLAPRSPLSDRQVVVHVSRNPRRFNPANLPTTPRPSPSDHDQLWHQGVECGVEARASPCRCASSGA